MTASADFFQGDVFHARLKPRRHHFRYPAFFMRLDVRELEQLETSAWFGVDVWRPLAFYQRDHGHRDGSSLLAWGQALLESAGIADPGGRIWLYTFPRVWGYTFKPVSFWHWHDTAGQLRVLLAEVNNTFGERHVYLMQSGDDSPITAETPLACSKIFHVSPFCEVRGHYRFKCEETDARYRMVIDYADQYGDVLHTSMAGSPLPFTGKNAARLLLSHPLFTFGIVFRIHWQALRLWLKGVPFFRKPAPPNVEVSS